MPRSYRSILAEADRLRTDGRLTRARFDALWREAADVVDEGRDLEALALFAPEDWTREALTSASR